MIKENKELVKKRDSLNGSSDKVSRFMSEKEIIVKYKKGNKPTRVETHYETKEIHHHLDWKKSETFDETINKLILHNGFYRKLYGTCGSNSHYYQLNLIKGKIEIILVYNEESQKESVLNFRGGFTLPLESPTVLCPDAFVILTFPPLAPDFIAEIGSKK
ncbi:hypothetical protein Glove_78g46 [Diversispora epigaea]|uniref:Uncharacterized protein n=1 Tax=Diversispora epigaea TaxID=1348612 RepID=A0A397JC36_9GLOM|nr:hypothetical protein Glove_78g46 [Diversispora epigaea]